MNFSADGMRVLTVSEGSVSEDSVIRVWDASTGAPLSQPLRKGANSHWHPVLNPDGSRILFIDGRSVKIFDYEGKLVTGPSSTSLANLAEHVAGAHFDERGLLAHSDADWTSLQEQLRKSSSGDDPEKRFIRWFLLDRDQRPPSPLSGSQRTR